MNTQTISQFELLDTELLATVEGGASGKCIAGVVVGALLGSVGGPWGSPAGGAVGAGFFC